jgi:hypothetical protein
VGPAEIKFIRETFGLSAADLARSLSVAPFTIARWESVRADHSAPGGLQLSILSALYQAALQTRRAQDEKRARDVRNLLMLGAGALVLLALSREEPKPKRAAKRSTKGRKR